MKNSPLEILEVLGDHFSSAVAEPGEALHEVISEVEKYHSQDRYDFVRNLGEGGLKKVTLENDKVTHRQVAISSLAEKQPVEEVLRFINETYLTARLEHNNIVPLYDFGRRNDKFYFSTKFLEGVSLEEFLKKDRSLPEKLRIFSDICDAISYAHSQGIVHLDIKPSNVQISDHSEVIVFDWGLARDLRSEEGFESYFDEIFAGTPGFTAPEQIMNDNEQIDEQTDIYSLGSLLFLLLTGKVPWKNRDVEQVLKDTIAGDHDLLEKDLVNASTPSSLIPVCLKAMAQDKKSRYETVIELKSEISSYLNGFVTQAEDASYFKMLFLLIKRHKVPFAISVVFLIALGLTLSIYQERLQEEHRKIEELNISKARVLFDKANSSYKKFEIANAEKEVNESLALRQSNRSLYLKAKTLLVKGDYEACYEIINKLDGENVENNRIKKVLDGTDFNDPDAFKLITDGILEQHLPGITLFMVKYKYQQLKSLDEKVILARELMSLFNGENSVFELKKEGDSLNFKCGPKVGRLISLVDLPVTKIDASGAVLYSIDSLRGMTTLKHLDLSDTYVEDLEPLKGLELDYLNLSNTCVVELKPLRETKVKYLDIRGQKLKYLTTLMEMRNIEKVRLDESKYKSYKDQRELRTMKQQGRIVDE